MSEDDRAYEKFVRAVKRTLRSRGLPGGPLMEILELGRGSYGFVVRGYVHTRGTNQRERVQWLTVKCPTSQPNDKGSDSESTLRDKKRIAEVLGPATPYFVSNEALDDEHEKRNDIGAIPGLGGVPEKILLDRALVLKELGEENAAAFNLPPQLTLLVTPFSHDRVVHAPPVPLADVAVHPVSTPRDLLNWCEIARWLGAALVGLFSKQWIHRDIKLGNVIVQMDEGFLRSLELIDFGTATRFGPSAHPPRKVGSTLLGTPTFFRPDKWKMAQFGQEWQSASPTDDDVYAYASVLGRVLLGSPATGPHPDDYPAEEIERFVSNGAAAETNEGDPLAEAIGEAFGIVRDLMRSPHHDGIASITDFLRRVEWLRIVALDSLGRGSWRATRELELLPALLGSLESCVSKDNEARWCDLYTESDEPTTRRGANSRNGDRSALLERAVGLLRQGYVKRAERAFDDLLSGPSGDPIADARGLRIYVGVLLLRQGEVQKGREVLARYAEASASTPEEALRAWWLDMLGTRLLQHGSKVAVTFNGNCKPSDERQKAWVLGLEVLASLRRERVEPKIQEELYQFVRRSSSTPEVLFAIMQLARSHAKNGDLAKALRWLHAGAGEASARGFPIEYASILMLAANLVLALKKPSYRRLWLDAQGIDEREETRIDLDTLFEIAWRLATHAADSFHRLEAPIMRDRAIRTAAACAAELLTFAGVSAAACLYELAAANATLSERESSARRMDDIAELRNYWSRTPHDPGVSEAQLFYSRFGWALEKLLGGFGIERVEHGRPERGAILGELLSDPPLRKPPRHILVIGCGTGGEVFDLADRFPDARVHGIDVSSWTIEEAVKNAEKKGYQRCTFRYANLQSGDPIEDDEQDEVGPWDLVVMRDTLAHVTFKRSFLVALRHRLLAGTPIRVTDLVQRKPSAPTSWRGVLRCMGITNLSSARGLRQDFEAAGFDVNVDFEMDASNKLLAFLSNRLDWFEKNRSKTAAELRAQALVARRVRHMLGTLVDACRSGTLGWVWMSADAADCELPPISSRTSESWSPHRTSMLPPR